MRKIALALAVVIGLGLAGMGTSAAQAAGPVGFHISAGGVHVDVGRVHHRSYRVVTPYSYGGYRHGGYYSYHPGTYYRHGHHLHYVPGHWDRQPTAYYYRGIYGY